MFVFQFGICCSFSHVFFYKFLFSLCFCCFFLLLVYIAIIIPKKNVELRLSVFLKSVCHTKSRSQSNVAINFIARSRKENKRTTIRDYKHSIGTFCLCLSVATCVYCLWFIWFVDYPRLETSKCKMITSFELNVVHI